jgi:hypothetical protein
LKPEACVTMPLALSFRTASRVLLASILVHACASAPEVAATHEQGSPLAAPTALEGGDTSVDGGSQVASAEALFTDGHLLFTPEAESGTTVIAMCWRPSAFGQGELEALYTAGRQQVMAAVNESWAGHSWLRVTWADYCEAGAVPVEIEDERSSADRRGVTLNFTFTNYRKGCAPSAGRAPNEAWTHCVRSLAVHEFGHVLGLDHEHNRTTAGLTCADGTHWPNDVGEFLTTSHLRVGPSDPTSVMSYCAEGFSDALSASDIEAVGAIYGADERVGEQFAAVVVAPKAMHLGFSGDVSESFTLRRLAGDGPLAYGDEIEIASGNNLLCASFGAHADTLHIDPELQFTQNPYDPKACHFRIAPSPPTASDEALDINEPVRLTLNAPAPADLPGVTFIPYRGALDARVLGPF